MDDNIKEIYKSVGGTLEEAICQARQISIVGQEENAELNAVRSALMQINDSFKSEVDKLETSSEWDKLCIAFFGETNAGKSTIIESLRIIYDEEKRRIELNNSEKQYEKSLKAHNTDYTNLLNSLKSLNYSLIESNKSADKSQKTKNLVCFIAGLIVGFILFFIIM